VSDQGSHPYITGKIIPIYTRIHYINFWVFSLLCYFIWRLGLFYYRFDLNTFLLA